MEAHKGGRNEVSQAYGYAAQAMAYEIANLRQLEHFAKTTIEVNGGKLDKVLPDRE